MAAPSSNYRLLFNDDRPSLDMIPLDLSTVDADLTATTGVTGGYCARRLYIQTAGTLSFYGVPNPSLGATALTPTARAITVVDGTTLQVCVSQVNKTGTSASGIFAMM